MNVRVYPLISYLCKGEINMFSVVFYDVRIGQTGDMMECLDHMTRSHFRTIMTNIHMECSYDKRKYQAYVFIGKSLGDVNSMTEFKYPYLLMADIIVSGFKTEDGYINIRVKRNTDFVSKFVRRMLNYSYHAFM